MYETLIRPHQVDVVPALPSIDIISTQLKQSEARREAKRLRQIANSRQARGEKRKREQEEKGGAVSAPAGAAETGGDGATTMDVVDADADEEADGSSKKKTKLSREHEDADGEVQETVNSAAVVPSATAREGEDAVGVHTKVLVQEATPEVVAPSKISLSKAFPEVRGHTSYLTFAILLPPSLAAGEQVDAAASTADTSEPTAAEASSADTADATAVEEA